MFKTGDRVSWVGQHVDATFYGILTSRPRPGVWTIRTSGGGLIDIAENRLAKVVKGE